MPTLVDLLLLNSLFFLLCVAVLALNGQRSLRSALFIYSTDVPMIKLEKDIQGRFQQHNFSYPSDESVVSLFAAAQVCARVQIYRPTTAYSLETPVTVPVKVA